jgi:predicted GIY-YIG superfamily endonuclease
MVQLLLLPDPRPLDRRLGRKFFGQASRRPGVYLMKDAGDRVLYVGKAKDLKQRLNHYRTANPDRMPRRHLRMVNEVSRVKFQFCPTEAAALMHEKKLIRSLKPKFNRAGVWPGKAKFIVWRVAGDALEISVTETPAAGWQRFGPLGCGATYFQRTLARLLWLAVNGEKALSEMPTGWWSGEFMETATIKCGDSVADATAALADFFWNDPERFIHLLGEKFSHRVNPFERRVIESELGSLQEFSSKKREGADDRRQMALL